MSTEMGNGGVAPAAPALARALPELPELPEPLPSLRGLAVVVAAARLGALGAAARALGMAQPTASGLVHQVEAQLGLTLFRRSPRGSVLSEEGQAVLPLVERTVQAVADLIAEARALRETGGRELRVGASNTVAEHLAPRWLGRLASGREGLRLVLAVANSATVTHWVRQGQCQVGFVEGPGALDAPGVDARAVGEDRLVVVVPPGHPWAARRRIEPGELAETPLVAREPGSGTREVLGAALAPLGLVFRTRLELGSTAAVLAAVRQGQGPGVVSELAALEAELRGWVVRVAVEGLELARQLWAIWPAQRPLGGLAAELVRLAATAEDLAPAAGPGAQGP